MKRILGFAIIVTLIFSSCANYKTPSSNSSANNYISDNSEISFDDSWLKIYSFNDNLAWIKFRDKKTDNSSVYYGCIDKTGKMLFFINDVFDQPTVYSNGYSHVKSDDGTKISVIDESGKICSSYNYVTEINYYNPEIRGDTTDYCVNYGDGYTVTQKEHSNFDENYYEYTIFNPDGEKLYQLRSDDNKEIEVHYKQCGVFEFEGKGTFFARSKKFKKNFSINRDIVEEGIFLNTYYQDDTIELIFLTPKGEELSTGKLPNDLFDLDSKGGYIYKDIAFIYSQSKKSYCLYNFKTKEYTELKDKKYTDKISDDFSFYMAGDRFIISINGKDGNNYNCIFDNNGNIIGKPIQTSYDGINASLTRLICNGSDVYNLDGKFLFSLSEKNCQSVIGSYSNGVLITKKLDLDSLITVYNELANDLSIDSMKVIDTNGNELFTSIDISSAKRIVL